MHDPGRAALAKPGGQGEGREGRRPIQVPCEATLRERPWRFDWFNLMRWFEARNPGFPRLGTALRPADEMLRVSQKPSLSFAPATLSGYATTRRGLPRLEQVAFGLYGPNGALPLHLTEYARVRAEHDKDEAQQAFSDIFHHRFALLFYRAWASAQSTVSLDRAGDDRFSAYVGSLIGIGTPPLNGRDRIADHAKRFAAGHLVRGTRNPEGLTAILQSYFGCRFRVQEWMPHWLVLAPEDRTALGARSANARLGQGAICGASVPDRQHRFRLHAGPLSFAEYESFLPGETRHVEVRDWVRNYVGFEFAWDLRLILRKEEVPAARIGGGGRLGWTTWMGTRRRDQDCGDLVLDCERTRLGAAVPDRVETAGPNEEGAPGSAGAREPLAQPG